MKVGRCMSGQDSKFLQDFDSLIQENITFKSVNKISLVLFFPLQYASAADTF